MQALTIDTLREHVETIFRGVIVAPHASGFTVSIKRNATHAPADLDWLNGQLKPIGRVHGFSTRKCGGYVLVSAVR